MQKYRHILARLLSYPGYTLLGTLGLIVLVYIGYAKLNHGVEFFPDIEPETVQLHVRARGDLSIYEKDRILKRIEERVKKSSEVEAVYARSFAMPNEQMGTDVIGVLQFQLIDWHERRRAKEIIASMTEAIGDIPGVVLEFREQEQGPGQGKPVQLRVSALEPELMHEGVEQVRKFMEEMGGFVDIEDDRTLPGIEWRIEVDREAAARLGADILTVGNAVQLVTNGIMLATYRPEDATDEVDIRVRLPEDWRSIDQLSRLTVNTSRGQVALSHFVDLLPAQKTGTVRRVDGMRTITIQADVAPGARLDALMNQLREKYDQLPEGVEVRIDGEDADQREAAQFLMSAFLIAIFMMTLILIIQFNSVYQTLLVLSAIVFSTAGVLLGLLVNGQSFGIVMVGMGVIALAGIVVNNNIILIDTYNILRREGMNPYEAALETGCLRLRPVLLTAVTTVLGLMPMVLGVNISLLEPSIGIGAPSTQWWTQLSSAIAGGLAFATVLTLMLTPCMLVLGARLLKR